MASAISNPQFIQLHKLRPTGATGLGDVQSGWVQATCRRLKVESLVCLFQPSPSIRSSIKLSRLSHSSDPLPLSSCSPFRIDSLTGSRFTRKHQVFASSGKGFGDTNKDRLKSIKEAQRPKDQFKALGDEIGKRLQGIHLYIIGDDGDGNAALAEDLAPALGYVPLQTTTLIQQSTGKGLALILAEDGPDGVAEAEASVLKELSTFCSLFGWDRW